MVAHHGLGHVALLAGMVGIGPWLFLRRSLLSAIDLHLDLVLVGLTQHGWSLFFIDVRAQDLWSSFISDSLLWLDLDLQFLIGLAWLLRLRCTELCLWFRSYLWPYSSGYTSARKYSTMAAHCLWTDNCFDNLRSILKKVWLTIFFTLIFLRGSQKRRYRSFCDQKFAI